MFGLEDVKVFGMNMIFISLADVKYLFFHLTR